MADTLDVALSAALDLEHPPRSQRPGEPGPQATVVGDPVQRRGREDRVYRLVQVQVQRVLAPHLRAVAEPPAREREHVRRGVQGQHTTSWHECQQRLGHAPGAAADVKHLGVLRDPLQSCEDLGGPGLLRLARASIRGRVPGSAHHSSRLTDRRLGQSRNGCNSVPGGAPRSTSADPGAGAPKPAGLYRDRTACARGA